MTLIFVYGALVSTLSTLTGAGHNQLSVGQCCQTAAHTHTHTQWSSLTWGRATLKGSKLTASTSRTSKNLRTIKVLFIFILVFFFVGIYCHAAAVCCSCCCTSLILETFQLVAHTYSQWDSGQKKRGGMKIKCRTFA